AASPLMASINSRALLESPPGAGAFIVTVAMRFLPRARAIASLIIPLWRGIVFQHFIGKRACLRAAQHTPLKRHSLPSCTLGFLFKSVIRAARGKIQPDDPYWKYARRPAA